MTDDAELLRRYAKNRSEEAFSELLKRHLNLVYFAALRRTDGDAQLAQDVTQLVFIALAREAASLQRHSVLAGWLYVTTRHAAANAMRTEQRRKIRDQKAHAMQENAATPSLDADWNQLRPELDNVMDELNEPDRDAVLLRFFEERTFADIGATLRISEDAARVRVGRALEKLRTLLGKRGISSTAAALTAVLANQAAAAVPEGVATAISSAIALSGIAARRAALVKASKTATTTLTQKALAVIGVTALASGLLYQAHAVQIQAKQIGPLTTLVGDWQRQARQLGADRDRIRAQTAQSVAARAAVALASDPELDERLRALLARAAKLKQRMDNLPDQQIPELRYLEPSNWLEIAQEFPRLETEADFRRALSSVRTRAKNCFMPMLKNALDAYLKDSKGALPASVAELARFFSDPLDAAILQRYEMRATGTMSALSPDIFIITEKSGVIDPRHDNRGVITTDSFGMTMDEAAAESSLPQMSAVTKALLEKAIAAYRTAHAGKDPETPDELIPYLENSDPELTAALKEEGRRMNLDDYSTPEAYNNARQLFRADHHGAYPRKPEELAPYFQEMADAAKYLKSVKAGAFRE